VSPRLGPFIRRLDQLSRRRSSGVVWAALLGALFLCPLYRPDAIFAQGHGDWLWFHFAWETARKSLLTFHEPLYWNPYYCGGSFGLANPQSFALSPSLLLLSPFPTALGLKVFLSLHVTLGALGVWELCRALRPRSGGLGALVAAAAFACSGSIGFHLNGQLSMANFELYPWVFLGLLRGKERPIGAFAGGAVLALMILDNGVYAAVLGGVGAALFTAADLVTVQQTREQRLAAVRALALAGFGAIGLSAVRLLPIVLVLRDFPRPIAADDAIPLSFLPRMLLERHTTETQLWDNAALGLTYRWWGEYGNYLGWVGLALVLAAWLTLGKRALLRERLTGLVLLLLLLGDHGPWSPFGALRHVPPFGSLRVPTRYWPLVTLFWVLPLSLFVQSTKRRILSISNGKTRALAAALAGLVGCFVVGDWVLTNGVAVHRGAMVRAPAPPEEPFVAFHQVIGHAWPMTDFPPRNQGTLRCFDEVRVVPAPGLRPDLPSEVFSLPATRQPGAPQPTITHWTPSEVDVRVEGGSGSTVVYNQTFYRGWSVTGGTLVPVAGLVAAKPNEGAGPTILRFRFRPAGFFAGLAVTTATAGCGWWLLYVDRKRARRLALR
jgi:hypothetical protein